MRYSVVLAALAASVAACDGSGNLGPGGLRLRDGVGVVHDYPPVTAACLNESACPGYIVPEILDVAHRGDDWLVLYSSRVLTDPGLGQWDVRSGYFLSRDNGKSWQVPDFTISTPYGPRIASQTLSSGSAFPTALFIANGVFYQVVPAEIELGTGIWTWMRIDRIDLDTKRIDAMGTSVDNWLHVDRDNVTVYGFNGENPQRPTYWYRFDPSTDPRSVPPLEQASENYSSMGRGSCIPPVWLATRHGSGGVVTYGGHCQRQYLASSPVEHCWYNAAPPAMLQPDWSCVPATSWPVPDDAKRSTTTHAIPERWAGVLWTEGSAAGARTRAATMIGTSIITHEVGAGEPLFVRNDEQYGSRAFGGVDDHGRWADLLGMSEETADGGRRTTLYHLNGQKRFAPTTLPTRACPEGADCGYRPRTINDLSFLPSTLFWAEKVAPDQYRLFYVVDAATEKESHIVVLTSLETLDLGPPTPGSELERACALEQACSDGWRTVEECVAQWLMPTEVTQAAYQRFTSARTCAEIAAADPTMGLVGTSCSTVMTGVECHGDVVVVCSDGRVLSVSIDCGRSGATCTRSVSRPEEAICVSTGIDCGVTTGCDASGRAVTCSPNPISDCGAAGTACVLNGLGYPTCAGQFAACTTVAQTVCDGTRIINCSGAGVGMVQQDCARSGLSCGLVDGYARCTDGVGACDASVSAKCDGSKLVYCLQTSLRSVDCASFGMTCGDDGVRMRCIDGAARPDLGSPPIDLGAPACGTATLGGPTVSELETANYPTPTGGTIPDGTYQLTKYELWSATAQPFTHRETLVFSGGMLNVVSWHSAIGLTSSTGTVSPSSPNLTYTTTCPGAMTYTWRYSVTTDGLVILDNTQIRTYTRQ